MTSDRFKRFLLPVDGNIRWALAAGSILTAVVAAVLLPGTFSNDARRMVFIFVIAATFWVFEILSLHATALLAISLEFLLLATPIAIFRATISNSVLFLFFGGFTLAVALHKHKLDVELAQRLLSIFGHHPFALMLGFMSTAAFFACWMSATATTAMMLILIQPLLAQTEPNDPFRKALVLSIPFGARIGGLCTPVGTPPNALAVGILQEQGIRLSFLSWMKMGTPLALILLAVSAVVLYRLFTPMKNKMSFQLPPDNAIEKNGYRVLFIAIATILLWLTSGWHKISEAYVSLGAAALIFSCGLLDRHDLKRIDWNILILMWGGLALGEGMERSGMVSGIVGSQIFAHSGITLLAVFCFLAMGVSTFMSNTAAANLLLPIAAGMPEGNPILLVVAVALACSFDVPIPISSPPNAMAFSTRVISVKDMLKAGIPITMLALALIIFGSKFIMGFAFGVK